MIMTTTSINAATSTKTTKVTRKDSFMMIRALLENDSREEAVQAVAFIDHELEKLETRSLNKKPTEKQIANEGIKARIFDVIESADKPLMVKDIFVTLDDPTISLAKVNALTAQLKNERKIVRTEYKNKAYFSIVAPDFGE